MKSKKFTLIELLAVVMIFGILASIGLGISKPSNVKNSVSQVVGLLQRTRAYAIENRCVTYLKYDSKAKNFELLYKNQFSGDWKQPVPGTKKTVGQGVSIKMYQGSSWADVDSFGLCFDADGKKYVDKTASSTETGLDLVGESFAIYEEFNKKNIFLIKVNLVGAYEIFEGENAIKGAESATGESYTLSGL